MPISVSTFVHVTVVEAVGVYGVCSGVYAGVDLGGVDVLVDDGVVVGVA